MINNTGARHILVFLAAVLIALSFVVPASAEGGNGDGSGGGKDKPLALESASIANGEQNVSLTPEIVLNFNKNVVHFTVRDNNMNCFSMTDSKGNSVPIDVIMGDDQVDPSIKRIVTIKPKSSLEPGETYLLKIGKDITSKSGVSLGRDTYISFTTAAKPSTTKSTTAKPSTTKSLQIKQTTTKFTPVTQPETTSTTAARTTAGQISSTTSPTTRARRTTAAKTTSAKVNSTTASTTAANTKTTAAVSESAASASESSIKSSTLKDETSLNQESPAYDTEAVTVSSTEELAESETDSIMYSETKTADTDNNVSDTEEKSRSPLPFIFAGAGIAAVIATVLIIKKKK
ncbi:MAG: Ig-like domain-containing protein [Clostridia bacterium]|nr:Ig-like domain-containing protein [Clostridia bacterium]